MDALAGACAVLDDAYLPEPEALREALVARLPAELLDGDVILGTDGANDLAWHDAAGAAPASTPAAHPLLRRIAVVQSDATHLALVLPVALVATGRPPLRVELTVLAVRLHAAAAAPPAPHRAAAAAPPRRRQGDDPLAGRVVPAPRGAGDFHRAGAVFVAGALLAAHDAAAADRLRALDRLLLDGTRDGVAAACLDGDADGGAPPPPPALDAAAAEALAAARAAIARLPRLPRATRRVAARALRGSTSRSRRGRCRRPPPSRGGRPCGRTARWTSGARGRSPTGGASSRARATPRATTLRAPRAPWPTPSSRRTRSPRSRRGGSPT